MGTVEAEGSVFSLVPAHRAGVGVLCICCRSDRSPPRYLGVP